MQNCYCFSCFCFLPIETILVPSPLWLIKLASQEDGHCESGVLQCTLFHENHTFFQSLRKPLSRLEPPHFLTSPDSNVQQRNNWFVCEEDDNTERQQNMQQVARCWGKILLKDES